MLKIQGFEGHVRLPVTAEIYCFLWYIGKRHQMGGGGKGTVKLLGGGEVDLGTRQGKIES